MSVAIALVASNAFAGALVLDEPVESEVMVEEEAMGSSGGWLVPLIIIGAIILIASSDGDSNNNQNQNR